MEIKLNLVEYMLYLMHEKGEDIFEYGFTDFDTRKYLVWLQKSNYITRLQYLEWAEDDLELFQIQDELGHSTEDDSYSEYKYELGLVYLTEYLTIHESPQFLFKFLEAISID